MNSLQEQAQQPNIIRQIASNTIVMVVGKILTGFLGLLLTASLTRQLGVFGYGEFTTVIAFLVFFGVFADFGFLRVLVRELASKPEKKEQTLNTVLSMQIVFAILIYSAAAFLVNFFPYPTEVKQGVMLVAIGGFFLTINGTMIGFFQAHHMMGRAVIADVVSRAVLLGTMLWGLNAGWRLPEIFWFYVLANFVTLLIDLIFVQPFAKLRFSYEPAAWRSILGETWSMGVMTILMILYFKIDTVILSILKGPTEVGIYGVPYKILEILILVPAMFTGNVFPAITRLLADKTDRLRHLLQASYDVLLIAGLGIVVGLIVLSKAAILLVAGHEFVTASAFTLHLGRLGSLPITAVHTLIILSLSLFFIFVAHLWSIMLIAKGHQAAMIKPSFLALVFNLLLNFIFIPRGSYFAAAVVTFITEIYIFFISWQLAKRYLPIDISSKRLWRVLLASLLMGLIIWPLRELPVLLVLAIGFISYALLLTGFGAIPPNAWGWLRGGRR